MPTKTDSRILDDILSAIKNGQTFCLSGHRNPDADVVGSQLAMESLIRRLGPSKQVDILNCGYPPRSLSFLPGYTHVKSTDLVENDYDVVITFESSGEDRLGNIINLARQAKCVINIDHHLHNPNYGTINFVEPSTSSTAELIFKIFERSGLALSKDEATCIYTGLVADTGCFRYGNTNVQSHDIAGKLLMAGVPVAQVSEQTYMSRSKTAMKLLTHALSGQRLLFGDRVSMMRINEDFYREIDAQSDDTDEIVNAGLLMGSVVVSVLLKEKRNPDEVKVSFRSKGETDINQVARAFDGGGHKNASGCAIQGRLDDVESLITEKLKIIFPS